VSGAPPSLGEVAPERRRAAVSLVYRDGDTAPVVTARGYGATAEAIIKEAQAHGLYVHGSPELVNLLMRVHLDQQIPPALYVAIAEVMSWACALEDEFTNA